MKQGLPGALACSVLTSRSTTRRAADTATVARSCPTRRYPSSCWHESAGVLS